jgi:anti-anti-sigma factor
MSMENGMPEPELPEDFEIVVSDDHGTVTIRCAGELDIAFTTTVMDTVQAILRRRPTAMALDWTGLTFMDSSGIRVLMRTMALCRDSGVDLTWSLSDAARKTLDLVGIHDALLHDLAGSQEPEDD